MKQFLKNKIQKFLGFFNLRLSKLNNSESLGFPIKTEKKIIEFINISNQYSMTGNKRMHLLYQAILNTKLNNLEGDFVECGIWKGGNVLLYKLLNDHFNLNKKIFGYDTFEGMSLPENIDIDLKGNSAKDLAKHKSEFLSAGVETVHNNIIKHSNLNNIHLIKGKVEETLLSEKNLPKKISILRLDTDWYSSTKIELEILYPRLVEGGILIIDDYGHWEGSKKAVDEYFNKKKWLHSVDYTCRYLIKSKI